MALNPELLTARFHPLHAAYLAVANVMGSEPPTLFTEMFDFIEHERDKHWRAQVSQLDRDIFSSAVAAYDRYAIEEIRKAAQDEGVGHEAPPQGQQARAEQQQLESLRAELDAAWSAPRVWPSNNLFLWKSTMYSRKKSDEGTDLL